jgi:3D (Asp-Asp-Asp) domain-containing protein
VGREYLVVEATAYYPGPNNYGGGVGSRTAIGMVAQRGIIAVDPSVIPLGTKLFIDGYGYGVAGDTGGAIQGLRVDLCYNTYDEAMRYGRQRGIKVYLLGKAW